MFIDDSYVDNIDTKDLVDLGQSLQNVAAGRITFLTVPTTGYMDEYGNEHLREDDNRAIFDAIINDDPLPGEKNADNTPVPGTPESTSADPGVDQRDADTGRRHRHRRARRRRHHRPERRDRAGLELDRPRPGWRPPPPTNCSSTASTSRLPTTTRVR